MKEELALARQNLPGPHGFVEPFVRFLGGDVISQSDPPVARQLGSFVIVERAIPYGLVQQELSPCHLEISCARFRGKFQLLDDLLACAAGISSPESQVLQRLGHRHAFEIPNFFA